MSAFAAVINAVTPWLEIACCCLIFGGPAAWLIHGALAGKRRKRRPSVRRSPGHPAGKALRGWSHLSDEERREFAVIACLLQSGAEAPEPQYRSGDAS